ncbi:MAG TPA: methyltransferase [Acidobacteriaceae bacterium]|nr:methyltransferase [Acidobacteriaceae bacterium]
MLKLISPEEAARLRALFEEAGYTEPNLRKHLGAPELPSRQLRNLPRLLDRTSASSPMNVLLRWFWLGRNQQQSEVQGQLSEEFLSLLLASGLIARESETYKSQAMLLPFNNFLVASDPPSAIESQQAEMVLWPNPTSKFLSRFAVRSHSRSTLDLGTGSGILSLSAASHSDHVIATDITERAATFARFNARLNGVENIEVIVGDCFAPVAGQTFDLILSNPPFFITPQTDFVFCENDMELDSLCRRLVKEAPAHLNEGGYLQMLCEWAQIEGQPWEERVAEWLEGTGCDAWVMKGLTQDPAEYAQHRIKEIMQEPDKDAELFHGYMNYYRQRGVEAIHDGLLVMRKRTGANWVRIEEVPKTPTGELGELILSTFAANDLLQSFEGDAALLATRPRLAPNVRLEQICVQGGGQWRAESLTLRLISGFPFHLTVQPLVAEFLATCDGTLSAEESIRNFAAQVNVPLEQVQRECIAMLRKLVERGFMLADL